MAEPVALGVGIRLKELVCRDKVWQDVTVQHSDAIGVVFEVQRTVAEGGTIETVVSQILVTLPLAVLFEISILLAARAERARLAADTTRAVQSGRPGAVAR